MTVFGWSLAFSCGSGVCRARKYHRLFCDTSADGSLDRQHWGIVLDISRIWTVNRDVVLLANWQERWACRRSNPLLAEIRWQWEPIKIITLYILVPVFRIFHFKIAFNQQHVLRSKLDWNCVIMESIIDVSTKLWGTSSG